MLKKSFAVGLLVLTSGCFPTLETRQIIVDGEASREFAPDTFLLEARLHSRNENQSVVLAEISERLSAIRGRLPNLEGLTHLSIDATSAGVTPILNAECMEKADYPMRDKCPVDAYFGSINISVKGSPARLSGHALSLLSELGAERVHLASYSLSGRKAAQQAVLDAAVKDARQKAEKIAGAASSVIVSPIRIQYGEGFPDREDRGGVYYDQVAVSASAVSGNQAIVPETELDLDPQPIKIEAKVVAAFEIE